VSASLNLFIDATRIAAWTEDAWIVIPLVTSSVLYARGASMLRGRRVRRASHAWQAAAFGAGCVVVAIALLSRLHALSEHLFVAHMVQHELLMVVAAPLLVLGRPAVTMLWALPKTTRLAVGGVARWNAWRVLWRWASRPFDAWLIHGIVIWVWHVPVLFQATLQSDVVHALQHLSFMTSALLFWWVVMFPRRQNALGLSLVYLFTTAVHTGVLGALMSMSRSVWYPAYGTDAAAWGLTPIQDQQLAGLVMWIPASIAYLGAALFVVYRWLRRAEWTVGPDARTTLVAQ
jgi:putative membrane protein